MAKVKLYSAEGKEVGEKKLNDRIFGVTVNPEVVHEVFVSLKASARKPVAHTKTRGEVRGGGKKPWKQKGTGRARHGSIRSPLWSGGGVTFGPRNVRSFGKKINRKTKQQAFFMTLSDKVASGQLLLLESFGVKEGKTKELAKLIGKLPVKGKKLLVPASSDESLARSSRNLEGVRYTNAGSLGMMDVLKSDFVLMTPESVASLEKTYGKKE